MRPLATLLTLPLFFLACTGSDDNNQSAPTPGVSAQGWVSSWEKGSRAISCTMSRAELEGADTPSVVVEETALFVGYEQVGDNQNPLLIRFDGEDRVYCQRHESEGPDGRAEGITWNGGDYAYVVYTVVGGGTSLEGLGGWIASYAPGAISGGGAKVSYAGRINAVDGALESGTFIIAVKSDNKVNSHTPAAPLTVLESGDVEFLGESAHKPIDQGNVSMTCTDYPFSSRYRFSPDLTTLRCADCTNCESANHCD